MVDETGNIDEELLAARDEAIAASIKRALDYKRALAAQMRREAAELETSARRIEAAVKAQKWWHLESVLDDEEIESLCEVSPVDLLGAIHEGP